jgi:hypothetical protein
MTRWCRCAACIACLDRTHGVTCQQWFRVHCISQTQGSSLVALDASQTLCLHWRCTHGMLPLAGSCVV